MWFSVAELQKDLTHMSASAEKPENRINPFFAGGVSSKATKDNLPDGYLWIRKLSSPSQGCSEQGSPDLPG
uniref:Uncharacterized protein n=1 Tax=Sphaerodactylus townsendi TaxID=933632 RepID=A0ACB8ESC8_9SAUR